MSTPDEAQQDTFQQRRALLLERLDRAWTALRLVVADPTWYSEDYGAYVPARADVDEVLRRLRGLNQVAMESREEGG